MKRLHVTFEATAKKKPRKCNKMTKLFTRENFLSMDERKFSISVHPKFT